MTRNETPIRTVRFVGRSRSHPRSQAAKINRNEWVWVMSETAKTAEVVPVTSDPVFGFRFRVAQSDIRA